MLCVMWPCKYRSEDWKNDMLPHYRKEHPEVKRPWEFYTKEARNNAD